MTHVLPILGLYPDYGNTVEDMCVLVDRETGAVIKSWDFKSVLTPGEGASGLSAEEDWLHCNALWYDEKTHSLTFSGRHADALINLDFDTGALRWILADPAGWPEDKQKYFSSLQTFMIFRDNTRSTSAL